MNIQICICTYINVRMDITYMMGVTRRVYVFLLLLSQSWSLYIYSYIYIYKNYVYIFIVTLIYVLCRVGKKTSETKYQYEKRYYARFAHQAINKCNYFGQCTVHERCSRKYAWDWTRFDSIEISRVRIRSASFLSNLD